METLCLFLGCGGGLGGRVVRGWYIIKTNKACERCRRFVFKEDNFILGEKDITSSDREVQKGSERCIQWLQYTTPCDSWACQKLHKFPIFVLAPHSCNFQVIYIEWCWQVSLKALLQTQATPHGAVGVLGHNTMPCPEPTTLFGGGWSPVTDSIL